MRKNFVARDSMVATAALVSWLWHGHKGAVGPLDLLWTGKGVNSAWGGIAANSSERQ